MAGLTPANQQSISFKKVSGKAQTQQNFAVTEEGITTNIQMSYTTVFGKRIEPLPVTNSGLTTLYSTNGVVQRVKFQIDIIPNTQIGTNQSQGYRLKLPSDWNTHPGALYPQYLAGTYLHSALGKLQIVPSLYGTLKTDGSTEYDPILYQTDGITVIGKFDPINWYFDPYNGIIFVQDPPAGFDVSTARLGYLEAFLYVGDYVDDLLNLVVSGSTGTTASNVGIGVDVFKDKIVNDLRFKRISGGQNISVTGTTNDIIISFTGTSGGGTITGGTNGLSVNGKNIVLGGSLTGDTTINGNNKQFIIQNHGGIQLLDTNGAGTYITDSGGGGMNFSSSSGGINIGSIGNNGGISLSDKDEIGLLNYSSSGVLLTKFYLGAGDNAKFIDNRTGTTARGIEYQGNYGANFTVRSLVDLGWVTGITSTLPTKTSFTISGNSLTTGFTITHNKNTRDVIVQIYSSSPPYDTVLVDVLRPTVNSVNINFNVAPTTGTNYRVLII